MGRFFLNWSNTNRQFSVYLFDSLYGLLASASGPLKFRILIVLCCIFPQFFQQHNFVLSPDFTSISEMWVKNSKVCKGALTKCPILHSNQFALFSFVVSRWYLKERFSSKKRSKYFVLYSIFIFCPAILKLTLLVIFLLLDLNRTNSVLSVFSNILLAFSHITIFLGPKLIFLLMSFRDLLEHRTFVSSAKWRTSENSTALLRSLIYIRKRSRIRTEPCGTPCSIGRMSELILLTETNCFRFSR